MLFIEVEHSGAVIFHLTNSSQLDTLQVKSPFLVKSPKFWYILGYPKPLIGNSMKHLLKILSILLLSSPVIGDNHKGETLYGWGKCYYTIDGKITNDTWWEK